MKKRLLGLMLSLVMVLSLVPSVAFAATGEKEIYDYLTGMMGMNSAAACGVLANIERESSFSPTAQCVDTNGLTSYGICQWNGARFTALKNYCSSHGYSYSSLNGQLHYLQSELESSESSAYSKVKNVPNTAEGAYTAGSNWAQYFERCAQYYNGINQYVQRATSARDKYWPNYGTGGSPTPPTSISSNKSSYVVGDSATVSWSGATGVDHYAAQLNKDGTQVFWKNVGSNASYEITDLEKGSYEFYVWSVDSAGKKSASKYCAFNVYELTKPTNLKIDSSAYVVGDSAKAMWTGANGVSRYAVQLNKDGKQVFWDSTSAGTSYSISNLEAGSYEFYVWSVSLTGEKSASAYCAFNVYELTKPSNLKTNSSEYTVGDTVKATWTGANGVSRYAVQLNKDGKQVFWDSTSLATSYSMSDLEAGSYEFYVWSVSSTGEKSSSIYCTFDVKEKPLTPPTSISADKSKYTVGEDATVSWSGAKGAEHYVAQLNKDGSQVFWKNVGSSTSYKITDLEIGSYEFYVWSVNAYGQKSVSTYCAFEVTHTHNYTAHVTTPTCTEQGYTTHTCSCGDSYVDSYTSALDHSWDNGKVTKEATETSTGTKSYTCTSCGATRTEEIPVLTHTHSYTARVTAPTCTEQGYTTHTCSCGNSYVDNYKAAVGHSWDNGKVTKAATETSVGTKTYSCAKCDATKTEEIPVLAHTHNYTAHVTTPTCTEQGYTTHTCACGDSYKDSYKAALGHEWDEGVVTSRATYAKKGEVTYICVDCGEIYEEATPMKELAQTKITSITNTKNGIALKWNKVADATDYQVYRKAGNGEWKLIQTTASTSLTSIKTYNGTKYQYKVRAVVKVDGKIVNKGVFSAVKTMYRLTQPAISSATNSGAGKITVKWDKNTKVTGYQVKYVKGSTTKTVKVKGAATLSKTLSKLTKGRTYKVYVRAHKTVDGKNYYSAWSAYKSVKVAK